MSIINYRYFLLSDKGIILIRYKNDCKDYCLKNNILFLQLKISLICRYSIEKNI